MPLGGRAGGQAGDIDTIGVAESQSDGKKRRVPSRPRSTHARVPGIREPRVSAQHFPGLPHLVVLVASLVLTCLSETSESPLGTD